MLVTRQRAVGLKLRHLPALGRSWHRSTWSWWGDDCKPCYQQGFFWPQPCTQQPSEIWQATPIHAHSPQATGPL